jgi:hypothetical protein
LVLFGNGNAATINASSCSRDDVNAAVISASTKDIVSIPAGSCTWTSGITIPDGKNIVLRGAGFSSTTITHGSFIAIKANQSAGNASGLQITGIGFVQMGGYPSIDIRGTDWRLDHNRFSNGTGSSQVCIDINETNVSKVPTGLVDNNDFVECRLAVNGGMTFAKASTLWSEPSVLGTRRAVYIEDNTFYKTVGAGGGNVVDLGRGASYVARYNTVTSQTQFFTHGLQADTERGAKNWELYGNKFTSGTAFSKAIWQGRSGTGVIFGNTHTNSHAYGIEFYYDRSDTSVGIAGYCSGSSYWDAKEDATGWPCRDQIGRGPDAFTWTVNTDNPSPGQTSQPAYLWLNRNTSTESLATITVGTATANFVRENRDYYVEKPSFDGTAGVGCGPLASRPSTCTTGVAYWATGQSCSDLSGMVGAHPATPFAGTLYTCTATNEWRAYYTPYAYPHPLSTTRPLSPIIHLGQ